MSITTDKNIIHFKLGKACVPGMVTSGYVFIAASIFPVITESTSGYIGGAALFVFGCFLAFSTAGVDLDTERKRLNNYTNYFNLYKTKNWISLDKFEYITVLMFNKEHTIYSRSNRSISTDAKKYDVYLTDSKGFNRQILTSFDHAKQATNYALKIAKILEMEFITFHNNLL